MKLKMAGIISGLLASWAMCAADSTRLDAATLKAQNETLSRSIYDDHDAETRQRNLATAYPLARQAWADDTLPARVRLAVIGTAGRACARAMRNHSSPTGATFHDCPAATNAVALIELLTKATNAIPKGPPGAINVMPPRGVEGSAAGMSPAGIKDPVARAAYEQAIAENKLRIEESNARISVDQAIGELETAVWCVMREIRFHRRDSLLPKQIQASSLPEKTKARFFSDKPE
jgi:hypothetical protein